MRYMNWSYRQLMECPEPYIEVIHEMARLEREQQRQQSPGRR